MWKRLNFCGIGIGSTSLFEEWKRKHFFIKYGAVMRKWLNFCRSGSTFEEKSWKQTRKRLTLYGTGSGSKKYSTTSTSLIDILFNLKN